MRLLFGSALLLIALQGAATGVDHWGREFNRFGVLLALEIGAYLLAAAATYRLVREGTGVSRRGMAGVWGIALLLRGLVLAAPLAFSDDLYRYIWDGSVLAAGINPYRWPPVAPELAALREAWWPLINHPELPTIYPPLLMVVFWGVAVISPSVLAFRFAAVLFDLAAAWFLMRGLEASGRSRLWIVLYLWHPLVLIEFAGSGHADAVGVAAVSLALWLGLRGRPLAAGFGWVLAGLVKFLPWLMVSTLIPKLRLRWILLPLAVLVAYLPFHRNGVDAWGSLRVYTASWRSNDFLYRLFPGAGDPVAGEAVPPARLLGFGVVLLVGLILILARRRPPSVYGWIFGVALLVSPVVHPWYVVWLLPAVLLAGHPAWWIWSLTVPLAYLPLPGYLETGLWQESAAVRALEYLPVLAALPIQVWLEVRSPGGKGFSSRGSPSTLDA